MNLDGYAITGEATEFRFSADATAYAEHGHEGEYFEKPVDEVRKGCELPLLLRDKKRGLYHVVLQSDVWDYSRRFMRSIATGGALGTTLMDKVESDGAFVTPWMIVTTASSAGKLVEQNYIRDALVDDRQSEPEWIVPGKAIRILDLTTAGAKEGVDFAPRTGFST